MTPEIQQIKQRFGIVGNSAGLTRALSIATRVAPTNLSVLIMGESGVGKEVFSQIIHAYSPRKHASFIAVNCGAIPEGTIDSELFGHEKGSFTGAQEKRKGYFETVNGGTIFLDEIGEMPMGTQSRLLRVLESGEFIKVGSSKVQKTDVRIIAATNVNLVEAVAKGKFREDLYYRLSTVPVEIPPLRERGEDLLLLFRKFMVDFAERNRSRPPKLDEAAQQVLLRYTWPGNVRQLKNVAEQVCVLTTNEVITAEEMIQFIPELSTTSMPALTAGGQNSYEQGFERELIYKMLFEIKNDIGAMKQFLLKMSGGKVPQQEYSEPDPMYTTTHALPEFEKSNEPIIENGSNEYKPTVIMDPKEYQQAETVEDSLNIADKEKELIVKALKKHRSKRKDAAADLGISERTLYRKIKEYNIIE